MLKVIMFWEEETIFLLLSSMTSTSSLSESSIESLHVHATKFKQKCIQACYKLSLLSRGSLVKAFQEPSDFCRDAQSWKDLIRGM